MTSRRITAATTLVAVLIGSCSGTDAADDDRSTSATATTVEAAVPDGWQQIDRAAIGFALQVPDHWSVTESDLDAYLDDLPTADTRVPDLDEIVQETGAIVAFSAVEIGTGTNISVIIEPVVDTAEDVLDQAEAEYPEAIASIGGTPQSAERSELDGHEALHVVFTLDSESGPLIVHQYVVSTNPLQTITFVTADSERDGPTLERIISTYRTVD